MESGNVVEFIDSQKIFCAVVLEVKNLRLRLLTENNREVKMAVGRLSHRSRIHLDPPPFNVTSWWPDSRKSPPGGGIWPPASICNPCGR